MVALRPLTSAAIGCPSVVHPAAARASASADRAPRRRIHAPAAPALRRPAALGIDTSGPDALRCHSRAGRASPADCERLARLIVTVHPLTVPLIHPSTSAIALMCRP